MRPRNVPFVLLVFSWLAPRRHRNALLGDLAEEYALRASETSSSSASIWYLRQICGSVLPLLWSRFQQSVWVSTLGVALCAYIAVAIVELVVNWMLTNASTPYDPLRIIVAFPM